MVHAPSLKRLSAVSVASVLLSLGIVTQAAAQDLARVNQDELASFYGRMNVVVGSGARAFGMGGAFLARADDATAASWNPAGLSYLRRTEFSLVGVHNDFSQLIPRVNSAATPARLVTTRDQLQGSVADFAGFAYPLRVRGRTGAIQVSYQRSFSFTGKRQSEAPVGGTEGFLPNGGRILADEFTVDGSGGFDSVSLSSGFEVNRHLRVGVSVNRWIHGFSQTVKRSVPDQSPTDGSETSTESPVQSREIFSTWDIAGTNYNFGLLLTPTAKLNIGAVLKTPFEAQVDLFKKRTDIQTPDKVTGKVLDPLVDQYRGDVQIRFPRVYGLGASYRVSNTLTVSADFTETDWSKATITNFFSLLKNEPDAPPDSNFSPVEKYGTPLPFPAVEERLNPQANASQLRMGAEWVLRLGDSGNVVLPVRAGFFRDGQPVVIRLKSEQDGPVSEVKPTFTGLTAGLGVTIGGVLLDVAYIREFGSVPASRYGNEVHDDTRTVRYDRVFASMMVRFGPRR